MIIKLQSLEIPRYWETIKFAAVSAGMIAEKEKPSHLNELLHALLSDKAQCFVRINNFQQQRTIQAAMVTRIMSDKVTGEKHFFLQYLYSFENVSSEIWESDIAYLKQFAKSNACMYIIFYSDYKRIWKLTENAGFRELHRTYRFDLGGSYGR